RPLADIHAPAAGSGYHRGMGFDTNIARSIDYLRSPETLQSFDAHCYWPKWDGPWWHMLLLREMSETTRIPEVAITGLIASLNRLPIHFFPISPAEVPQGQRLALDSGCHCQMGTVK